MTSKNHLVCPGGFFVRKNNNKIILTSDNCVDNILVDKGLDGWYAERDTKTIYKQTRNASNV